MMSSSSSKKHRFFKIVSLVSLVCFILSISLHQTSNMLKNLMFTNPSDLEDWEDHIQIAVLLKGKKLRVHCI